MAMRPNVARVFDLLLSHGGQMPVTRVESEMLHAGLPQCGADWIRGLAEKFPDSFRLVDGDEIEATLFASTGHEIERQRPEDAGAAEVMSTAESWWATPAQVIPLAPAAVAVLDIETTGLDHDVHHIWQIAVGGLASDECRVIEIEAPGRPDTTDPLIALPDAITLLAEWLAPFEAVCGHGLRRFDLPFLAHAAASSDVAWEPPESVLDVHELSLLVDPTLEGRSLVELARWLDIPHDAPHEAPGDVAATRLVARELLARFDTTQPSFALAHRLLSEGGNAWARLITPGPVSASLDDVLTAAPDPLSVAVASKGATSLRVACDLAYSALALDAHHRERPSQREMSDVVADALDEGRRVLIEAPTGTGKSLGYLVPAAARAQRAPVVIATATKVLQRQLRDDALRLRRLGILNAPFRQIQGVSNYLCVREIAETIQHREATGTEWAAVAVAVRALHETPSGVWDDVTDGLTRRSSRAYSVRRSSLATSAGTCERARCEWSEQCPMMQRLAGINEHPGIIAANHALVATWLADDEARAPAKMFGELPTGLVLDEAHTLEDSMASAWSGTVSAASLRRITAWLWRGRGPIASARQLASHLGLDLGVFETMAEYRKGLPGLLDELGASVELFLHEYGGTATSVNVMPFQRNWPEFREMSAKLIRTARALETLRSMLRAAAAQLGTAVATDGSIASRSYRKTTVGAARRKIDRVLTGAGDDLEKIAEWLMFLADIKETHRWVHVLSGGEQRGAARPGDDGPTVRETWEYTCTPIEIGDRFATNVLDRSHSVVMTSATLRVGGSFDFLAQRLSLRLPTTEPDGAAFRTEVLRSPFDYDRQSSLVLTTHLPVPTPTNEREFVEEVAADQVGFLSLSLGRAMTLFAARTRMQAVAELVETKADELAQRGVRLLVQHREAPAEIRRTFREHHGTVAYGLRSYWEGFDAPGDTLSYLFIEKPPYPHPGDPIAAARQRAIEERGGDPFTDYVVPRTAITMAQGFGRLIRTETDRGVAFVYDRRLTQPRSSNAALLSAIPTDNVHYAVDRDDAWSYALRFVTGEEPDLSDAIILIANTTAAALEELRLLPGEDPDEKLARAAKLIFGIDQLHDSQLALMRAVLAGRDSLGFLPTGRGKSLCFQLPALLHPEQRPFVVVSPLVALIKDQVDELRSRKGLRAIVGITGRTSVAERTEAMRDLADGKVRVLYLSPERLVRDPTLQNALTQCDLGALVVDEAHCISSWGHDFRPEFRQIAPAVRRLKRSPRMGLTATATPEVEDDIVRTLQMKDPVIVREPANRPDLRYWTFRCGNDRERTRELLRFIAAHGNQPGIVYATRRALTERLAWVLRQAGHSARSYHAGMIPEQREAVQEDFLAGNVRVIVATKAFGMGVNKPDIGWIVHYDLPDSVENYAQESGRAARAPELTGDVVLFWNGGDIARQRRHVTQETGFTSRNNADRLLRVLSDAPRRGADSVVEPDELAEQMQIDSDELNVLVAWLEQAGAVERKSDCTLHGHVTLGRNEPKDSDDQRRFVRLTKGTMRCVADVRRMIDLEDVAARAGLSPDELEELLIGWTLDRHVTFQGTRRGWRIEVLQSTVDPIRFGAVVGQWRELQRHRLDAMAGYVESSICRRVLIAKQFDDAPQPCGDGDALQCDVCADAAPPWHSVPSHRVPDPDSFVDARLVVLQSVAWMSRNTTRPFSEGTIKAVILGNEQMRDHPISPAALRCPQFGALRHVRGGDRQFDKELATLIECKLVERFEVEVGDRSWNSVRVTDSGRAEVKGCG